MNLTYLAATVAIVLVTMLVYALLSWGRTPSETPADSPEPSLTPAQPESAAPRPQKSPRPRRAERPKARRNAS